MVYKDKALWTLTLTVPAKEIIYSYIVLDDFDPNAPILWEPRIDRNLKPGQVSTIDDWGVCNLFLCILSIVIHSFC